MSKLIILFVALASVFTAHAGSYLDWKLHKINFNSNSKPVSIRAGYLEANPSKIFKGNVLFYQGLGDSMLNHDPLFQGLVSAGYRVIAFDYMGQGGSAGSMNDTRIDNINELGEKVVNSLGREVESKRYHIIGWSTGGLAAYKKAFLDKGKKLRSVVLIAPGIKPNYFVGEGIWNWPIDEITFRTLTTNRFIGVNDPHEDPIEPNSPLAVPKFAWNLQKEAKKSRKIKHWPWFSEKRWIIPKTINGLVLLSGRNDTYVGAKETIKVLKANASHFQRKVYDKALHEIDNEQEVIAKDLRSRVLKFLNSN